MLTVHSFKESSTLSKAILALLYLATASSFFSFAFASSAIRIEHSSSIAFSSTVSLSRVELQFFSSAICPFRAFTPSFSLLSLSASTFTSSGFSALRSASVFSYSLSFCSTAFTALPSTSSASEKPFSSSGSLLPSLLTAALFSLILTDAAEALLSRVSIFCTFAYIDALAAAASNFSFREFRYSFFRPIHSLKPFLPLSKSIYCPFSLSASLSSSAVLRSASFILCTLFLTPSVLSISEIILPSSLKLSEFITSTATL